MNSVAPYVLSLGLICSYFFPFEKDIAILIALAIPLLLHTLRGTFQTVVLTDIIQFFFMYLGPVILLNFLFSKYGGFEFFKN